MRFSTSVAGMASIMLASYSAALPAPPTILQAQTNPISQEYCNLVQQFFYSPSDGEFTTVSVRTRVLLDILPGEVLPSTAYSSESWISLVCPEAYTWLYDLQRCMEADLITSTAAYDPIASLEGVCLQNAQCARAYRPPVPTSNQDITARYTEAAEWGLRIDADETCRVFNQTLSQWYTTADPYPDGVDLPN